MHPLFLGVELPLWLLLLELFFLLHLGFFSRYPIHQHCAIFRTLQHVLTPLCTIHPITPLPNAALLPYPPLQTFWPTLLLTPLQSLPNPPPLPVFPRTLLSIPLLSRSGFSNGTQEVFMPEMLNCFTFFRSFLSILFVFRNLTSTLHSLSSSG